MKIALNFFTRIVFISLISFSSITSASTISSDWTKVLELRPIIDGTVYFKVDNTSMCNTDWLRLNVTDIGSQATYSALLAAMLSEKEVKLESWGECAEGSGWGTVVQAVNVRINN